MDYYNNTADCTSTGVYKKTLVVNTRFGNAPDINNGPGGGGGPLVNLDDGSYAFKCKTNAAGFVVQSEYNEVGRLKKKKKKKIKTKATLTINK